MAIRSPISRFFVPLVVEATVQGLEQLKTQPGFSSLTCISLSRPFWQDLVLRLQIFYKLLPFPVFKMDYQTPYRSQKRKSPTDPNSRSSSSKESTSSLPESASIRYYTALAKSSTPYISPYAQDDNRRTQPPTTLALRAPATSTSRSTTVNSSYKAPSAPTKGSLSTYSSSSGGSLYTSSPPRQTYAEHSPGSMSSSKGKTMSSVSRFFDLSHFAHALSRGLTNSLALISHRV